jgi:hypothetical protein
MPLHYLAFEPVTSTNQTGPLAEQPIAATDSSQYNFPADLGLGTASQNPNKKFQLIVRYFITVRFKQQYQSIMQQDLVNFSLLKTISIALVARIFETSIAFD